MILALVLLAIACASWLGFAAAHVVALRRVGCLDPPARTWAKLKVVEYGLLLLIVVASVFGAPRLTVLAAAATWVVIASVRIVVKRRLHRGA